MPVAIQMPQRQRSTIDAFNDGLGAITRAYELKRGIDKAGQEDDERKKKLSEESALKDPTSQESAIARRAMQQAGVQVGEDVSAFDIEKNFGGPAKYNQQQHDAKLKKQYEKPAGYQTPMQVQSTLLDIDKKQREKTEADSKKDFTLLPIEKQEQIKELGKKNANKTTINNQLKAALKSLNNPKISDEQKRVIGDNLAKTLNSTEGADAVGNAESERILAWLNSSPFGRPGWSVGPQLGKFTEQVDLKTKDIDDAINSNNQAIDQLYGRSQPQQQAQNFEPDVLEYAAKHNISPEQAQTIKASRSTVNAVAGKNK